MGFQRNLDERFPGAMTEGHFVSSSYQALRSKGFTKENTIACVGVCRDELCRSLVWAVRDVWGDAFNFSSLGGLLTLGTAGFQAAHYHAPIVDGRERYLYIVMPHIGLSEAGVFGKCLRAGRHGSSVACGALTSVFEEYSAGPLDYTIDHDNIEYSMLKQHLGPILKETPPADIVGVTLAMANLIAEELQRLIDKTVDTKVADYAVLLGVQIHRPIEGSMVWLKDSYTVIDGERTPLQVL